MHQRWPMTTEVEETQRLHDKFSDLYRQDENFRRALISICERYSSWADRWIDGVLGYDVHEAWWECDVDSHVEWNSFRRDVAVELTRFGGHRIIGQ